MSELKPCPFCGESKLLYSGGCGFRYDDDDNQIRLFRVHCRTCRGRTGLFESLDEAVEAWNRRTNSTTIQPSALGTNLAEVGTDCISRQAAIDALTEYRNGRAVFISVGEAVIRIEQLPPIQPKLLQPWEVLVAQAVLPQPKRGKWILDRSGAYCCSECMEPCAGYVMMKPRDKFCKMCGSRNEVTT